MAQVNVGEIITTTLVNQTGELANNVENNNAILSQMKRQGKIKTADGGSMIVQELDYAENTNAGSYDGYDTLATNQQSVLDYAQYAWKQYYASVVISGREKRMNSGDEKVIDLIAARVTNAKRTLRNRISAGMYGDGTGNGGKDITGLAAAIPTNPTTGTYGGINRVGNPWWQPKLQDPAVTPTSATIQSGTMNPMWVQLVRDTDKPNLIVTDNIGYQLYEGSLQPQQRFSDAATADAGFENIKYKTAPVVLDGGIGGNCPPSTMYFLNTDYLHWRPHQDANFVPADPESRDPVNQDATVKIIIFMGNLTCSGQQFQGIAILT